MRRHVAGSVYEAGLKRIARREDIAEIRQVRAISGKFARGRVTRAETGSLSRAPTHDTAMG
jgi:hypothetical protein